MKKLVIWSIALYVIILGFTLCTAMACMYDNSLVEELNNYDEYTASGPCYMPGCENPAEVEYYFCVDSVKDRHKELNIPNKANCDIFISGDSRDIMGTYHEKEDYILISRDENGDYRASLEEENVEHSIKTGSQYTHTTALRGNYCSEHSMEALNVMRTELTNAIYNSWIGWWGHKLFPLNVFVLTVLLNVCLCIARAKKKDLDMEAAYIDDTKYCGYSQRQKNEFAQMKHNKKTEIKALGWMIGIFIAGLVVGLLLPNHMLVLKGCLILLGHVMMFFSIKMAELIVVVKWLDRCIKEG